MPSFPFFTHKQISVAATEIILQVGVTHTHFRCISLSFSLSIVITEGNSISFTVFLVWCWLDLLLPAFRIWRKSLQTKPDNKFSAISFAHSTTVFWLVRFLSRFRFILRSMHFALSRSLAIRFRSSFYFAVIHFLYFHSRDWLSQLLLFHNPVQPIFFVFNHGIKTKPKPKRRPISNSAAFRCHTLSYSLFVSSRKKKTLIKNNNNNNRNKRRHDAFDDGTNQQRVALAILFVPFTELGTLHWTLYNKSFQYVFYFNAITMHRKTSLVYEQKEKKIRNFFGGVA